MRAIMELVQTRDLNWFDLYSNSNGNVRVSRWDILPGYSPVTYIYATHCICIVILLTLFVFECVQRLHRLWLGDVV